MQELIPLFFLILKKVNIFLHYNFYLYICIKLRITICIKGVNLAEKGIETRIRILLKSSVLSYQVKKLI